VYVRLSTGMLVSMPVSIVDCVVMNTIPV